jgi:type II secretory pathway pseudopilin PulG
MTNLKRKRDHKIYGSCGSRSQRRLGDCRQAERGATLVALLAVMTFMTLLALAAAPSILQQAQREREQEAIFRGEQVAEAIRLYYNAQVRLRGATGEASLPTSIDNLLEGVSKPGLSKKLQVLRASAAKDPLTSSGEWRFIRPHSNAMADFTRNIMLYTENVLPATRDTELNRVQQFMAPPVLAVSGLTGGGLSGDDLAESSTGPFIGVTSRSKQKAVIYYYGIDQHNQWVFTPFYR